MNCLPVSFDFLPVPKIDARKFFLVPFVAPFVSTFLSVLPLIFLTSEDGTPKLFAIGAMILPSIGVIAAPAGPNPETVDTILLKIPAPIPLNGAMNKSDNFLDLSVSGFPPPKPPKEDSGLTPASFLLCSLLPLNLPNGNLISGPFSPITASCGRVIIPPLACLGAVSGTLSAGAGDAPGTGDGTSSGGLDPIDPATAKVVPIAAAPIAAFTNPPLPPDAAAAAVAPVPALDARFFLDLNRFLNNVSRTNLNPLIMSFGFLRNVYPKSKAPKPVMKLPNPCSFSQNPALSSNITIRPSMVLKRLSVINFANH